MCLPVRVAILLPSLNVGGAEVLILEEMKMFSKEDRVKFELIIPYEAGPLYEKMKATGVKLSVFNGKHTFLSNLITYLKLIKYLRQQRIDILHIHLLYHGSLLGRLAGIPNIVTTVHNYRKFSLIERLGFQLNDKIFGCGEMVTNLLKTLLPQKNVACISNGLSPNIFYGQQHASDSISKKKGDIVILSTGRLVLQKGYTYLIQAMEYVTRQYPFINLYIAGDGEQKAFLKQQIVNADLEKNVILLGYVENAASLLSNADIYVNASVWEGLPMSLLEAMRSSLPIIATNIEGNSGIIAHEKTGLLVDPKNPEALARAIEKLIKDPALRKELGKSAYQNFKNNYTIQKHCEVLLHQYMSLLSSKNRRQES